MAKILSDDEVFGPKSSGLLSDDEVFGSSAPPKAEQGDYLRGLKKYVPQMQEMYGAGKALVGKAIDSEGMVQSGIETMQDANRKVEEIGSKPTDEFTNVKDVGGAIDWAQHGLGQVTGNLAESLVAAGAGTLLGGALGNPITAGVGGVGGLVGKQILKKALKEQGEAIAEDQAKKIIGKEVGQNAAIAGMAGFHGAGETGSRAFQEANYDPNQVELGQVLPRAAGHAAAEFLGDKILLGGMLGKGAYRSAGEGAYPLVKTVAGNMAIVAGKEIPVELVQTVLERDAAKLELMSPEARDEYINTAAQTMLFGIAGAPAGVRSYMAKPPQQTQPMTQEEAAADLSASNTELAGATAAYDALPSDVPQIGYNGKPDAIIVPNQSGGTTEINRNDGALSAAVVDTGITGQMLDNGTTLVPFASRDAAQIAIDQREDADRLTVVPHPRVSGRFAMVPKNRLILEAQDQAAMRRQQLEQEDGNAPQLDEAGNQGRGSVAGGGGGNESAVSGIGAGSGDAAASSVHGRGTSMAMGAADATESALGNADPEIVQARANNYYATANAILNDGGSREEAMSLFEKADTLQRQAEALRKQDPQVELAPAAAQPVSSMPGMQAVSKQRTQEATQQAGVRSQQLAQEEGAVAEPTPQTVNVPRPMKVGGLRAAKYSDAQLQAVVDNESVPATSRRAAAAEIAWRQSEAESAAQAEIAQSTGKLSPSRQKAAGRDPYAVAQEANDRRSGRTTGMTEQAPDNSVLEEVKDEALPDAKDTDAPGTLTKQGAKSLRMLAKLFGKKIVIFKTYAGADGFYINGNTIYIKSDSSVSQLRVLGHEMMHALRRQAPKVYQQMLDAVSELLTDAELKAFYADYNKGETMPAEMSAEQRDALVEEWMADLGGNRWGEAEFWSSMFAKLEEQHGTTLAKKIINQLRMAVVKVINSLLRTIRGGTMFAVDRRMADNLEKIREAMAQGFADYAKAVKDGRTVEPAGEGGVKFSGKQTNIEKLKKLMTDREKSKVGKRNQDRIVELFNVMPSENEMAAVAYAGKAKRGWYKNSANALSHLFGAEARRFAGLLAALSPQVSVEVNTRNALRMWANWDAAGRPTDKPSIMRLLGQSVEGSGTEASVMGAWVNNSMDALTIKNLDDLTLSGPKVNSFMLNLVGNWEEVTNDAWVANYALVDQNLFSGTGKSKDGSDPGKGAGYLAMNVKTRMAAKILSKETGVTWTPAEVQETIWSWAKTMLETLDASGETRTAKQLMDDGVITDDLISATPDFELLFRQEPYAGILRNAGLGQKLNTMPMPKHEDPGRAPFADEKRQSMLDEAGRRIEFLQRQRRTNMQISWEAKPGRTTGILPGIFGAPLHVQQQYLADIFAEFDMLQVGKKLGIDMRRTLFGPSAWKGDVAAGAQTILQKIGIIADNMGSVKVDADSRKNLEVAASILGYVLNQEGVYWHYPIYRTPDNHAMYPTGVEVNFGRSLTTAEVAEFYGIVSKLAGHQDWAPANTPIGVRFLNFTSFNDNPEQQFDHKQFEKIIERSAGKLKPWANGATMRSFTFDGDAIENNWKESPNGEDYKSRVGKAGRSDLLKWADDQLSPAIERVNKRYADQYGWGPASRLERDAAETGATPDNFSAKFSPARYERPAANGGVAGQGRPGDRQLGRVDVTGTHYSREQRKHLTGGYFGTGLAGEEGKRLKEAKDTRLHSRLYAYVNEGQGVFPEAGVGAYAHTVKLDNLYDIKADPLGIRQKTRDANDRESLILDAGFDGYYAPQVFGRQGVAILMGGAATRGVTPTDTVAPAVNVETAPKTERRTDLPMGKMTGAEWKKLEPRATDLEDGKMYYRDAVRFSPARAQTDTPEFKAWFGDSKVVDADGKPLVVYHGTPKDFSVFKGKRIWVTSDTELASVYTKEGITEQGSGGNIMPLYVSIKNPKVFSLPDDGLHEWSRSKTDEALARDGHDGVMFVDKDGNIKTAYAFDPTQIKSAIGNRGTFDATNPDIRYSPPRWYFSPLEKAFESAPDKVFGQAAQVKLWLAGNKSKLGLKDDEIFWTGINDWLDMQGKQKVSKADVLGYLAGSGVQVEEVMKGVPGYDENDPQLPVGSGLDVINATDGATGYEVTARNGRVIGRGKTEADAIADAYSGNPDYWEGAEATKFGQYTLPGGESYRELLLTLPPKGAPIDQRPSDGLRKPEQIYADPTYRSSHWEEPNILAHIRMNDRTDADGKRVLFVEEIQSDWNQEGRKKGFVSEGKLPDGWSVEEVKVGPYSTATKWAVFDNSNTQVGLYADTKEEAISSATKRNGFTGGVQTGPFVTDTKATVALAVKRIMAYAAANGYDKVAFINGEQSADRYDLSKQVNSISWRKNGAGSDKIVTIEMPQGTTELFINKDGMIGRTGRLLSDANGKQLDDVIGKEITEKVLSEEEGNLSGDGLKIGGEGMVEFYDRIVPSVAGKLVGNMGGKMETVRVGTGSVDKTSDRLGSDTSEIQIKRDAAGNWGVEKNPDFVVGGKRLYWNGNTFVEDEGAARVFGSKEEATASVTASSQTGFTVTPKMSEPLPLFSPRRQTETPEFKAWFSGSKVVDEDGKPLVVYHGTNADFSVFKPSDNGVYGAGVYFTKHAGNALAHGKNNIAVYLSIQNPIVTTRKEAKEILSRKGGTQQWANEARAAGYDGIYVSDEEFFIAFRPEQVKSAIGNNGQFSPTDPDIRRSTPRSATTGQPIVASWASPEISSFDNIVRQLQDKLIDTKRVVNAIKGAGKAISDVIDPYLQEILYHGRAAKKTQDFAEQELRPLLQSMQVRKVSMQEIEDFLWAQHAPERNAQNAKAGIQDGSGLTDGESRDILAGRAVTKNGRTIQLDAAKMPAYRELAKRFKAINDKTLDELVAYGLETRATVDQWKRTYQNYVPLMRDMSDDNYAGANNRGLGTGKGFSIRGSASKRAIGSQRGVIDIVANIAMQRERAITRGEKNKVSQATYGLALAAPNPDFWLPIDPAANRNPVAIAKLQQDLINLGMNPIDAQNVAQEPVQTYIDPNTGKASTRINPALRNRNDVLAVRVNGEDKFLMFSSNDRAQAMVANLKNLDDDQLGGFLQASAKVTRWFAAVNTQYNPVFGMVNGLRDFSSAMLNLTSTPLAGQQGRVAAYGIAALRGIYADLRDRRAGRKPSSNWEQEFEEFASNGGQTGYRDMFNTAEDRTKALQNELQVLASGKGKKLVSINENNPVFAWLSDYNTAIENAFRLAAYKVAKENGMTPARAAQLAKNLTVNFNKKGLAATQTGALYAFFNAAVQGTARIGETLLQHNGNPSDYKNIRLSSMGKKIVLGGITLGVMQALLGAMAGWDDDEPKQFQRERNLIIPIPGSDKYVSIPMPLGFHVLPNIGRITTEFVLGGFKNPGKKLTDLLGVMAEAFNPIGNAGMSLQTIAPTFADPLVALATNKDWNGQSIAREDFNRNNPTPGWTRTKDTATPWAKALAYGLNYISGGGEYGKGLISPSPDQIDYLVGQVTGGVGREAGKLAQTVSATAKGEELPKYKIPVVGRFIGETTGVGPESGKYYSNLERIGAHKDPIKRMREDGKNKDVMVYYRDNPEARLIVVADRTQRDISELKTMKRKLEKRGDSQDRINMVNEQIKAKMLTFNNHVQKLEKQAD